MDFNPSQLEAIRHNEGPMMVLAGPGSGKTSVITERIGYLTDHYKVDPSHILVVTFTRAAAREMRERYVRRVAVRDSQISGDDPNGGDAGRNRAHLVTFGTFHSIFFTILKYAYHFQASNIVRDEQKFRFVREMTERLDIQIEDENEFVSSVLGEISFVKSEMIDIDHYYSSNCSEEVFKQLYNGYEECMKRSNLIDFDDMLIMCYKLFKERPDILKAWQDKFTYILVDEFQDIDKVQYEIVRMLAAPQNNLFIVGDDDQSIYCFRGAKPEIMLGFPKDYPDAGVVKLEINYRSTDDIVDTASKLIEHNEKRYKKDLKAFRGPGRPVMTLMCKDPGEETEKIIELIKDYRDAGYALEDMAVLYRTNMNPRLLIERLMEYNIPFTMRDSLPNLYDHWISQNVIAYIRAARGDLSRKNLIQIINRPNRYISRDALGSGDISLEDIKEYYKDKSWMVERIEQLEYDLLMLRDMSPVAALNYIRKAVGYEDYLKEYAQFRRMKPEELTEILDQLKESASEFTDMDAWFAHMDAYREKLKEQAQNNEAEHKGVVLMTMHSSKGLEFPIVFILDANEGITPHRKAVLDPDIEEERRMFYVAMTRAKDRLYVFYTGERYGRKQERSRFIGEYLDT